MWVEIILFLFLGGCAVCDGLKREIPLVIVWIGIIAGVILHIQGIIKDDIWLSVLLSLFPGIMFWLISFVTREKVGYGDGWLLIMIGIFVGLRNCFLILLAALVLESIIVLVLLAVRKISGDRQIPFAPFLLLGMGVVLCL